MWIHESSRDGILQLIKKIVIPKKRIPQISFQWNYEIWQFAPGTPPGLEGQQLIDGIGKWWGEPVIKRSKNLVVNVGLDQALKLITGEDANHFDNSNAHIGAGNSNTAAAAGQTDLQGGSKHYEAMDASYPDAVASRQTEFRATFESADAQYAWEEVALFNGNTPPTDVMMSRTVSSFGTKPAAAWIAKVFLAASAS